MTTKPPPRAPPAAPLVERARRGEPAAVRQLVERHRGPLLGMATAWLKDAADAEDAVQDALVEGLLRLDQLRDPAALGAWLRRVVVKHCDRRTRRARPDRPGPDDAIARPEAGPRTEGLRAAVEALDEHERLVVALHYFGEAPQREVAELLELPLATVKKRLERARRKLGAALEAEPEPPRRARFADRIALFLALRAGDRDGVAAVLQRDPRAVNAPERWSDDEALSGGFTLAHRATPLVAAARLGDRAMVELLLSAGAEVDGRCGCAAADTPLFAAVAHRRLDVAERLLAAGARTEAANGRGFTPLLLAAFRGDREAESLLLSAGADGEARALGLDRHALREAGYAGLPTEPPGRAIRTDIRGLDAWAPIARGMRIEVHGEAETGLMVLMAELSLRLARRGMPTRWVSWAPRPWLAGELDAVARGYGIAPEVILGPDRLPPTDGAATFVFVQEGFQHESEAWLGGADPNGLLVLVRPWASATTGALLPPRLRPPFDAVWVTSPELARAGIFPALDPERTRSRGGADAPRPTSLDGLRGALHQPFFVCAHETGWLPETPGS